MKRLSIKDKLFFFERNFFTLDGLWMVETEKHMNWEIALKIDLEVWKKLIKIILRRVQSYLNIKSNNLIDFIEILTFRWSVEGWDYEVMPIDENQIKIIIKTCPYKAAMDRNPNRHEKIPLVCKNVCIPLYKSLVDEFNPEINFERSKYMGLGDKICDFNFKQDFTSIIPFKKNFKSKKKVRKKDRLFYYERNFKTLDGLWVIEIENEIDFDTALKLDILVWQSLYEVIVRRLKKHLNIGKNNLKGLIKILSFIWNCEGNLNKFIKINRKYGAIHITKCPYIEAMENNPHIRHTISSICHDICNRYLDPVIKSFNPNIIIVREKFIGDRDKFCDFRLKYE